MKGILIKEYFAFKTTIRIYVLLAAILLANSWALHMPSLINLILPLISMMILMNSFSHDEGEYWEPFAITLGIHRKELVYSKYMFSGLILLIATLISITISIIKSIFLNIDWGQDIYVVIGSLISFYLAAVITIPLSFKYGIAKAQILFLLFLSLPIILFLIIRKLLLITNNLATIIGIFVIILVILSLPLSIIFSLSIIKKKSYLE